MISLHFLAFLGILKQTELAQEFLNQVLQDYYTKPNEWPNSYFLNVLSHLWRENLSQVYI